MKTLKKTKIGVAVAAALTGFGGGTGPVIAADLEEIVVTAQRRAQSVQDIPYNIAAISAESLENANIRDIQDLFAFVPGFTYSDRGGRGNLINSDFTLRGLGVNNPRNTAGFANGSVAPVSTYLNDTPMFLNLELTDLERVEVLRGPQGTLYGSGALAGTVRFIYNRPDSDAFNASVKTFVEQSSESDDQNFGLEGVVNIPLSDRAAIRVSAGYKDVAGVFDANNVVNFDASGEPALADPANPLTSGFTTRRVEDSDTSESYHVRAALNFDVNDDVNALFSIHSQHNDGEGEGFRTLGADLPSGQNDSYSHDRYSLGSFEQDVTVISLEVEAHLGFATLTSSTSYTDREAESLDRDLTSIPLSFEAYYGCNYYGCYPRLMLLSDEVVESDSFTQEFRLVSDNDSRLSWVAGMFYSKFDESFDVTQDSPGLLAWAQLDGSASNIAFGSVAPDPTASYDSQISLGTFYGGTAKLPTSAWLGGNSYIVEREREFTDMAVFGELSYDITDRTQITVGARFFDQEETITSTQIYSPCGSSCSDGSIVGQDPRLGGFVRANTVDLSDSIFKFNISHDISDEMMLYATWSQGFRHGGANSLPVGFGGLAESDLTYEADETTNIEVGLKGTIGDSIRYSAALFNIVWDKPQADVFVTFVGYQAIQNGEEATSQGLESDFEFQLTDSLHMNLGYAYTDAEISEDSPNLAANEGDPLNNVPEHNLTFALDYQQPIGDFNLNFHLDGNWKSDVTQNFNSNSARYLEIGSSATLNASVSLVSGEQWSASLYVRNLTDEETIQGADPRGMEAATSLANVEWVNPPRLVGLNFGYNF